ncbi:ACP phosphodiesterase [Puia sp.]|jgi:acyl carrier protein phosphodiesterase|uniref:acyl carrier protein phosphodiesterase n=1 Tax=Puia sp. TaxID=2045100 RepID=UPI002F423F47
MNYLAHAYLSFDLPEIAVGNLISDFVKGKQKDSYPPKIRQGIMLHRAIDGFTDAHPVTRKAKSYFREDYGLYSGPLTDIIYDHFLANDPVIFPPGEVGSSLKTFARKTYEQVGEYEALLPERFARMFHYMRREDWLAHYGHKELIFSSFEGLARRAKYMPGAEAAKRLFEAHYADLEACYLEFFPELKDFALRTLGQLQM